ncbi:MAG TPA: phenylalanine--tRNA ligase subunit beta [Thermomicrobiales bacterium]|nr:phenylalanine--tRNA ligase subunit beta [Thermomicrobiales bacterium]
MKVPFRWLQDLVTIDLTPEQLAERMTLAGLEAENIEHIGAEWDKVYVGEVVSVTQHPDADRLVLADVDAGEHRLTVVTGAPNIAQGQKVALALAGARLVDAYADELKYKTLKPGKIRGIMSEGMVCSEKELGISDEHEGILVLEPDAPKGMPLQEYLGDTVIEFEITPNLVHAFSVLGIAREASAIVDTAVREPELADLSGVPQDDSLVRIDAPDLCARYSATIIDNVKVEPSPTWLARRLVAAGVRPVNNLVDVTNYVMLEIGQPLHAFDLTNVAGGRIIVRRAGDSEQMETLDHTKRTFTSDDLLITDAEKPVAVAGVMGGVNSEVTDDTTSTLLESANFDMVSVRHTARNLKLRTDASARFERGLDPELVEQAARRATKLILDLCPGATVRSWADAYPNPVQPGQVSLPFAKIGRLLGMEIPKETVLDVLTRLGFQPAISNGTLTVQVPTWRSDVTIPADVIEEVARIVGYDALPATLPEGQSPLVMRDPLFMLEREIRRTLVASGSYEGRSYIAVPENDIERWSSPVSGGLVRIVEDNNIVRLKNPLNAEQPALRTSIVPSLASSVIDNLKHESTVRLFELGHVYIGTEPDSLPEEPTHLGLAWAGYREHFDRFHAKPGKSDLIDFYDVKGTIDAVFEHLGLEDVTWERAEHAALHPGRTARVSIDGQPVGILGEVRPDIAHEIGIEDQRLVVAELDVTKLLELRHATARQVITVDRFLPVEQDFAVIVDRGTTSAEVEEALRRNAGPLLTSITLFDVFEGEQIGADKKSLAYRLRFTAPDRALTDAELGKVRKKIERGLKSQVNGALRA